MKKTYILDTNVLLTEPNSLYGFEDNDVVLPFTIIEELDKIKSRPNEVGSNAREVARQLSEMIELAPPGALKEGIQLRSGGMLRVLSLKDVGIDTSISSTDWDLTNKDNQIIEVCRALTKKHEEQGLSAPILVSRDILLRIKCNVLGICCEDFKGLNVAESIGKIFKGHITIDVPDDVINSFWEQHSDGFVDFEYDLSPFMEGLSVCPNEFVVLKNHNVPGDPAIIRWMGESRWPKIVLPFNDKRGIVYGLKPRNYEQRMALDLLTDPEIDLVTMIGLAGSGKTILAVAAGLHQVLEKKRYKKLMVMKPTVAVGSDIGYLPGDKSEKLAPWIAPIIDNLRQLMFSGKKSKTAEMTMTQMFEDGTIEVEAITYLRGRSISDAFIIIDESQNISAHELKTIITRVGENTKIVLTGDVEQIDNVYLDSVSNGLSIAVEKFKDQEITAHLTLKQGERSRLATLAAKVLA